MELQTKGDPWSSIINLQPMPFMNQMEVDSSSPIKSLKSELSKSSPNFKKIDNMIDDFEISSRMISTTS